MSTKVKAAVGTALEVTGTKMSDVAMLAIVSRLKDEDENAVLAALERCMTECKYRLTLADIMERLPGHAGADAAWEEAMAFAKGFEDETITVITRRAIVESFPIEVWKAGDRVGARMAFKERYPDKFREYGDEPFVSPGHDAAQRAMVVHEAVERGVLPRAKAAHYLPQGDAPPAIEHKRSGGAKLIGQVLDESSPEVIRKRAEARRFAIEHQEPPA